MENSSSRNHLAILSIWAVAGAFAILLSGCRSEPLYDSVELPMASFVVDTSITQMGAASVADLSCYLFSALHGDISFDQLNRFIPDSATLRAMYRQLDETPPTKVSLKMFADSIQSNLRRGFLQVMGKAAVFHTSWEKAEFEKLMILDMEGQKLPSKKIIIETMAEEVHLRATVKCLQIGNRWYLGEGLRFGV